MLIHSQILRYLMMSLQGSLQFTSLQVVTLSLENVKVETENLTN